MNREQLINLTILLVALLSLIVDNQIIHNPVVCITLATLMGAAAIYGITNVSKRVFPKFKHLYIIPICMVIATIALDQILNINVSHFIALAIIFWTIRTTRNYCFDSDINVAIIALVVAYIAAVIATDDVVLCSIIFMSLLSFHGLTNQFKFMLQYTTVMPVAISIFLVVMALGGESMFKNSSLRPESSDSIVTEQPINTQEKTNEPKKAEKAVQKPAQQQKTTKSPFNQYQNTTASRKDIKKAAEVKKEEVKPLIFSLNEKWSSNQRAVIVKLIEVIITPKYTEVKLSFYNPGNSGTLTLETSKSNSERALAINVANRSYLCSSINGSATQARINVNKGDTKVATARFASIPRNSRTISVSEGFLNSFHQKSPATFEFINVSLGEPTSK